MSIIKIKNSTDVGKDVVQQQTVSNADVICEEIACRDNAIKHFRLPNGSKQAKVFSKPVHYRNKQGELESVDNSFYQCPASVSEADENFAGYCNVAGDTHVRFNTNTNSNNLFIVSSGKHKLAWTLLGKVDKNNKLISANNVNGSVNNYRLSNDINTTGEIIYRNFVTSTDLQYIFDGSKIKENIIVKSKQDNYIYQFELKTTNLTVALNSDSTKLELHSTDSDKHAVFAIPMPYMYDASGVSSQDVTYELDKKEDNKYLFTITADSSWINNNDRQFPITIDPEISVAYDSAVSCQVMDSSHNCVTLAHGDVALCSSISNALYSVITVDKTKLGISAEDISSVSLYLQPYEINGVANILLDGISQGQYSEGLLILDITRQYQLSSDNSTFSFTLSCTAVGDAECNMVFLLGDSTTMLTAEYTGDSSYTVQEDAMLLSTDTVQIATGTSSVSKAIASAVTVYSSAESNDDASVIGAAQYTSALDSSNIETVRYNTSDYYGGIGWNAASTTNSNISVFLMSSLAYKTKFTVDISSLNLRANTLLSAVLTLNTTVDDTSSFKIANKVVSVSDGAVSVDLADLFNNNSSMDTVEFWLEPISGTNVNFDFATVGSAGAPEISIAYVQTRNMVTPVSLTLANHISASVSPFSGELSSSFVDLSAAQTLAGVDIGHVFASSGADCGIGANMKLNMHECYMDEYDYDGVISKIYLDASNTPHVFTTRYYKVVDDIRTDYDDTYEGQSGILTDVRDDSGMLYSTQAIDNNLSTKLAAVFDNAESAATIEAEALAIATSATSYIVCDTTSYAINDTLTVDEFKQELSFNSFISISSSEAMLTTSQRSSILSWESQLVSLQNAIDDLSNSGSTDFESLIIQIQAYRTSMAKIAGYISTTLAKSDENIAALQALRVSYIAKLAETPLSDKQIPVHFLFNNTVQKGFSSTGHLVSISDMLGHTTLIEYVNGDSDDFLINRIIGDGGAEVQFNYSTAGLLSSMVAPSGDTITYTYTTNDSPLLRTITNPSGLVVEIDYIHDTSTNSKTCISAVQTSNMVRTELLYEDAKVVYATNKSYTGTITDGSVSSVSMPSVSTEVSGVDDDSSSSSGGGGVQLPVYNHQMYSLSPDYGETISTIEITYTDTTTSVSTTSVGAQSTTQLYTFSNDLCAAIYSCIDGYVVQATHYTYVANKDNAFSASRDILNNTLLSNFVFQAGEYSETATWNTYYMYNSQTQSDAYGKKTVTTQYDQNLNVLETSTETTVYNVDGDDSVVTQLVANEYNSTGMLVCKTESIEGEADKGNAITTYAYSENDGVKSVTVSSYNTLLPDVVSTSVQILDPYMRVTAEQDTYDNTTSYNYVNNKGSVSSVEYPNDGELEYQYDSHDRVNVMSQEVDNIANSNTTSYTYGLVTQDTSGKEAIKYTYDSAHRLTNVQIGTTTSYRSILHSINGSTTAVTNANGGVATYNTDIFGNSTSCTFDTQTMYSNTFDNRNRLTTSVYLADTSLIAGGTQQTVSYSYDDQDRPLSVTVDQAVTETMQYNIHGDVTTHNIANDVDLTYSYTYGDDSARRLYNIGVSDLTIAPTYDTIGKITGKVVSYSGVPVATETVGYATSAGVNTDRLSSYNYGDDTYYYTYDSMNNISSISDGTTYAYDDLGRLVQSTSTIMGTRAYTYDNNGNILTRTADGTTYSYSYTSGTDRLASYNGELCSYDAIGNPTTYRGKSLTWSHGRQLDKFDTVYFRYNGMGQRIKKDTLEFTYDASGNLVQQSNGMKFIYDHTGVVGMEYVNRTYIYRKNPLGDIIAILDESGTAVVEYSYDAWGNYTVVYEKYSGFGNTNPFKYRGYYHDKETGLYYLQSRYYDPETGRFINADTIDYLDPESINGLNLYAYCLNNPVMYTDSTGTNWWSDFWNSTAGKVVGTILVVAAVVALTVATAGIGTAITGALGSGLAASIVGGAVGGAISGAIMGAGISMATQGISGGYGNIDYGTVGMSALTGAISGALLGGAVSGIKYCRAASYLKSNGIADVKGTLSNFKGIPSVKTSKGVTAFRYFDDVNARQVGKWLTNTLSNNPIDDLVLYNNSASKVSAFVINSGTKYLSGRIAGSSVNAIQYFVGNINWLTLLG